MRLYCLIAISGLVIFSPADAASADQSGNNPYGSSWAWQTPAAPNVQLSNPHADPNAKVVKPQPGGAGSGYQYRMDVDGGKSKAPKRR